MNGEVDLELYTVAMTRLNNGFSKVGEIVKDNAGVLSSDDGDDYRMEVLDRMAVSIKRALSDFRTSCREFRDFLSDVRFELDQSEVNLDDFEPFFDHVKENFPRYRKDLLSAVKGVRDSVGIATGQLDYVVSDLEEIVGKIVLVFDDIYSLADGLYLKRD